MSDPQVVQQLKQAAQDSLNRGFKILICQPHKKDPWAKYSPNAVNSAESDPAKALAPWNDGHEANYGVAGGKSNLTIIDCDSGLQDEAALYAWMAKNGLPETFIVKSGRITAFGAHLYYSGAVQTTGYQIDGVVGELRGIGAYVVGPGSLHPSGQKYEIIKDIPCASLPENMVQLAAMKHKTMSDFKPGDGNLIPEGNRWNHLQSKAGKLKDLGLGEEAIYVALKDFCSNHCENGDSYPDEKIRNLAEWAASDECEASPTVGIITCGSPDPEASSGIPDIPLETIDGDYVGDLSTAITEGTFVPVSFARADLKTIMGAMLDGNIVFPGEETLHMRHWTGIISTRPESGKSVCWNRCVILLADLMTKHDVKFPPAGFFSSGEHAIKVLSENDNKSHVLYFDEMKTLFEKGNGAGSTLFPKLLELYEQKASAVGSLTHNSSSFSNVSLSMAGNFTRAGYDRAVAGKGAGGDGFLSRMVLDFSEGVNYQGDWAVMDTHKVNAAVNNIAEALKWLLQFKGDHNGLPYVAPEDDDAKDARMSFQKWLVAEKSRIQQDSPDASYASRLEAHFKRDLLIRVAFTPERRITKALVEKSWAWARHQLMLREELWPVDQGGAVEKFEKRIVSAISNKGPLTKAGIQKFSNAANCEGGYEAWNRAWTNLLRAERVVLHSTKDNKGREKFGLFDSIWSKDKKKWLSGSA
jgi:bifunctional DNA primase/polymerase-like protein